MSDLTNAERLILSELLTIQNMLDPQEWRERQIDALQEGYTRFYPSSVANIPDEISKSLTSYVYDVFDMYTWLQCVLRDPITGEVPRKVRCPGFDGNGSGGAYSYALFLINRGRLWGDLVFGGDGVNSHGSEPDYERMLSVWRTRDIGELSSAYQSENQNPEHIEFANQLLNAGRPPGYKLRGRLRE